MTAFIQRTLIAFAIVGILLVALSDASAGSQQRDKVWHIGLLHVGLDHVPPSLKSLQDELKRLGYEEGKNLRFDWRNQPDDDAALATAREFVKNKVDLIVAFEDQSVRAAQAATRDIPIVFLHVYDPVAAGYIQSLPRPGGNTTGAVTALSLLGKEIELLKEFVPSLRRLLLLIDPTDPQTPREMALARGAVGALGLEIIGREIATEAEAERVFASLGSHEADAVVVVSPRLRQTYFSRLVHLARAKRWPVPGNRKSLVEEGALFAYTANHIAAGPMGAEYIDRILKGARPADMPVEEVSRFNFVVGAKVADELGIPIPTTIQALATEIIE
jgi:putative ABC transport system substrate-binding protein